MKNIIELEVEKVSQLLRYLPTRHVKPEEKQGIIAAIKRRLNYLMLLTAWILSEEA